MKVVDEAGRNLEAELLKKVAVGDDTAFPHLYDRLSAPLFSLVRQMTNDDAKAQDALFEGFTLIWRRAFSYDPQRGGGFSWAVTLFAIRLLIVFVLANVWRRAGSRWRPAFHRMMTLMRNQCWLRIAANACSWSVKSFSLRLTTTDSRGNEFLRRSLARANSRRLSMPLGTVKARIRRTLEKVRGLWKEGI
jgi:RNA polymerase sigma-70 factor (ECF subfamily)